MCVGPVMGEVTSTTAIIMLEVKTDNNSEASIVCDLYCKKSNQLAHSKKVKLRSRVPKAFIFSEETDNGLEPDTEYIAVFSGVNSIQAPTTFALFKTKPTSIEQFRIIAFSCDRPDRMLLGQKNP